MGKGYLWGLGVSEGIKVDLNEMPFVGVDWNQLAWDRDQWRTVLNTVVNLLLTWGLGIFLLTTASRTALGPTQPPIQWILEAVYLGVKRSRREADHSPPSSAEVNNAWICTSTPQYTFMAWCSVKSRREEN